MEMYGNKLVRLLVRTRYIWFHVEEREESSGTKILFIALSMRKFLTRSVGLTQRERTIVSTRLHQNLSS